MIQRYENNNLQYNNSKLKISIGNFPLVARFTDSHDEFLHSHAFFEIVVIHQGSITHRIKNETYVMNVGDACIIAPDVQHSFKRSGKCSHRDIMISVPLFQSTCNFLGIDLYEKLQKDGIFKFNITIDQISSFENDYYAFNEIDDENIMNVFIKTICCQLIGTLYTNKRSNSVDDVFKSQCINIINENFANKNVLKILLNSFGYTQGYFCKKFKNSFQTTPIEYINRKKIISAASTLILTNDSIEQCCYSVGFDSVPHFIKLFKQHYETTPTKYRQAYRLTK